MSPPKKTNSPLHDVIFFLAPSEVKEAQKRVQEVMQDPEATRSDKAEALKSLKIRVMTNDLIIMKSNHIVKQ